MAPDHPVVVAAEDLDHLVDVGLGLDPAGAEAGFAGEDRVEVDRAAVVKLVEKGLGQPEVSGNATRSSELEVKGRL